MNILFVLQRYPGFGGIENVTATLSEAFCSKLGHNVVIFSTSRQKNDSQMIKNKCWKYITSDLKGSLLISFFQRIVKENNIDLIIYQDSYVPEEYLIEPKLSRDHFALPLLSNAPESSLTETVNTVSSPER
jgi:hypothetical protein